MSDENFLLEYEKLLNKGYCNCNEMNCIDNDSPRRILKIAKNLQQENQELKKQLEDYKKWYQNELEENYRLSQLWCDSKAKTIELEIQQTEFIKWLDNESKELIRDASYHQRICIEIMEKYKEIIGDKE